MQFLRNFLKSTIKACPYSLIGKKCMGILKAKPDTDTNFKNKIHVYKTGIKTGRHISLVGVFCPFLWYSILSGASKDFIILNVIHSGIIVGIGLVVLCVNYVALYSYTKSTDKA